MVAFCSNTFSIAAGGQRKAIILCRAAAGVSAMVFTFVWKS
jgi:hypothetical protein